MQVLVVDDDQDCAESMAVLLRLCGYDVEVAHSVSDALRMARLRPSDAILTDLNMPRQSGLVLARQVRRHLGEGITIIAVTAQDSTNVRDRCLAAGFNCYFVKPANPDKLISALQRAGAGAWPEP